jgi:hypothetical protein
MPRRWARREEDHTDFPGGSLGSFDFHVWRLAFLKCFLQDSKFDASVAGIGGREILLKATEIFPLVANPGD